MVSAWSCSTPAAAHWKMSHIQLCFKLCTVGSLQGPCLVFGLGLFVCIGLLPKKFICRLDSVTVTTRASKTGSELLMMTIPSCALLSVSLMRVWLRECLAVWRMLDLRVCFAHLTFADFRFTMPARSS